MSKKSSDLTVSVVLPAGVDEEMRMAGEILIQELKARGLNPAYSNDDAGVEVRFSEQELKKGKVEVVDQYSGQSQEIGLESVVEAILELIDSE